VSLLRSELARCHANAAAVQKKIEYLESHAEIPLEISLESAIDAMADRTLESIGEEMTTACNATKVNDGPDLPETAIASVKSSNKANLRISTSSVLEKDERNNSMSSAIKAPTILSKRSSDQSLRSSHYGDAPNRPKRGRSGIFGLGRRGSARSRGSCKSSEAASVYSLSSVHKENTHCSMNAGEAPSPKHKNACEDIKMNDSFSFTGSRRPHSYPSTRRLGPSLGVSVRQLLDSWEKMKLKASDPERTTHSHRVGGLEGNSVGF